LKARGFRLALLGFCVALCCYNVLAALNGARSNYGEETTETKVSNYFLTDEIAGTYRGMMVALPPTEWRVFQSMSKTELAAQLCQWASVADVSNYPKHAWAPKKPKQPRPNAELQHVSIASPCLGCVDVSRCSVMADFRDCHYIIVFSPSGGVGGFRSVTFNALSTRRASGQPPLTPRRSGWSPTWRVTKRTVESACIARSGEK
jgi:hypothetical protein